jgi:PadR family transcriptional regulator, regulatory protein PadR
MIARNNTSRAKRARKAVPPSRQQDAVFGSAIFRGPVKTKTIVPLLILHLLSKGPEHGYGLMERIAKLTGDVMPVNSNTMYPLLRRLEERGFIAGEWEHPDRRSRRNYKITRAGAERYAQIKVRTRPHLDQLIVAVNRLRTAVFGARGRG